jgi:MFS superfamily sulfate permease-like transporter
MSPWSLVAIPLCLGIVVGLLWGVAWFEQQVLSPRSMILYTARSRHVGPDTVELLVARQSEGLLKGLSVQEVA